MPAPVFTRATTIAHASPVVDDLTREERGQQDRLAGLAEFGTGPIGPAGAPDAAAARGTVARGALAPDAVALRTATRGTTARGPTGARGTTAARGTNAAGAEIVRDTGN